MAAGFAQASGNFASSNGTTVAKAYVSNLTAGSLLVCMVGWASNTQTASVADGTNGAWTAVTGSLATQGITKSNQIFYRANTAGGVTPTVTATTSASNVYRVIIVAEYTGMATTSPLDPGGSSAGIGSAASGTAPTASATSTVDHDLFVGGVYSDTTATAGAGLNGRVVTDGNAFEDLLDKTPAGAQAMAWTQATGAWAANAVALLIAGGGGATLPALVTARSTR